jgi:hypothetical protein
MVIMKALSKAIFLALLFLAGCGAKSSLNNQAPETPSSPSPGHRASGIILNTPLHWQCSDPEGDPLLFDVYFGVDTSLTLVASNISARTYQPTAQQYSTTYYWKIVAKDDHDNITAMQTTWYYTTQPHPSGVFPIGQYETRDPLYQVVVSGDFAYFLPGLILYVGNPATPEYAGALPLNADGYKLCVIGEFAYTLNGRTLQSVDISDPYHATLYDTYTISDDWEPRNFAMNEYGTGPDSAYIYTYNSVYILTVHNGDINNRHSYYLTGHTPRFISAANGYIYYCDNSEFEVRPPSVPYQILASCDLPSWPHDIYFTSSSAYLACGTTGLHIVDVSNPFEPEITSSLTVEGTSNGIAVSGNYAYIAAGSAGLQVVNIANPAWPTQVAAYQIGRNALDVFYSNGYIYVACDGGLYILRYFE